MMTKLSQIKIEVQRSFQRMTTRQIIGICLLLCMFLIFIFVLVVQKFPDSKFPTLVFLLAWIFPGVGGLVMIIRREMPFSGQSENPLGVIFGVIVVFSCFGVVGLLSYLWLTSK